MLSAQHRQPSGESAKPRLAVAIAARALFRDVFKNLCAHKRGKPWRRQHAIDDCRRESGAFVLTFDNRPGGAAREPERAGLLVKPEEPCDGKSISELPDFRALSRLDFSCGQRHML